MNSLIRNSAWWIGILLLQMVLIFYFRPTMVYTPYIYVWLLFRVSNNLPRIGLLVVAFLSGLLIDTFTNSWGVHAFAAVFIAFILPLFVNLFSERALSEEAKFLPNFMGGIRYGIVLLLLFFIYHLLIVLLWNFSFTLLLHQLLKAFVSSLIASLIVLVLYSLFSSSKEEDNG